MLRTLLLLFVVVALVSAKKEKSEKKEEKKTEKKVVLKLKRGPGAQFLFTVRQRLSALHLQLSVDFRALSACKSAACRAAARARIRDVKRAELLTRRARGHIRLGRIFRDAAKCTNSHCRARLRREVREEQRKMRALIRRGANERAKEAKLAAARLARRASRAAQHAAHAKRVAHHLNHHEKRQRANRFLHLARHFHGLGLLYAKAADCRSHRCERRNLRKIRIFRRAQKHALERLRQRGVLEALKRARTAADDLSSERHRNHIALLMKGDSDDLLQEEGRLFKEWNDLDDVDAVYKHDAHSRRISREVKKLFGKARRRIRRYKRHPTSSHDRRSAARALRRAKAALRRERLALRALRRERAGDEEVETKKIVVVKMEKEKESREVKKAKKVAKKLEKVAKKEAKALKAAAEKAEEKGASEKVVRKLEKKAELDEKLAKDFHKAEKCEGKECIREIVEEVKETRKEAAKEEEKSAEKAEAEI